MIQTKMQTLLPVGKVKSSNQNIKDSGVGSYAFVRRIKRHIDPYTEGGITVWPRTEQTVVV